MPIDIDRLRAALADRYAIEREIGRGGMATVFLAEDLKHGRQVAVKVLEPELAASLGAERFLREIETAARLNHPHILPLHDSGEADGFLFYVMPYMSGDSLRDRLDRESQLPVEDAVRITREVAGGLDYAHEQGVVHRDIKPGNIMLSRGHAVIADFGIARAVDEAGGEQMTKTGISLGSPVYMSPEQASGSAPVDGRTDIYALGCVLYEMLAGEPPYTGKTTASIVARKELESAPKLGGLRDSVPERVEAAVAKSLAKVPADRFTTAGDFGAALSETPTAPSPADLERPRRRVGRTAIAAAFIVAIAATGWLLGPGSRTPADADADLRSIAVLPFESRTSEEDSEFFAAGVHEDILAQLTKIDSLKVISLASVARYADSEKSVREIADELGVATVLQATFQQAGDQVRINLQLIAAEDERHLWAETYSEQLSAANVFAIQADVAKAVARALRATLSQEVEARIDARPTEDLEAYRLVLRGREFLNLRTPAGFETALDYFNRAIGRDSKYALAWVGAARAYYSLAAWHFAPWDEVVPQARAAVSRALELDDELAEAHSTLAFIHYWIDSNFDAAERSSLRALELNPNAASAHTAYAGLLRFTGRLDEALVELQRARELNPLGAFIPVMIAQIYLQTSRFEEALEMMDQATELQPEFAPGHAMKAFTLMALERFAEARAPAEQTIELEPRHGWATALGWLLYWERDYEAALAEARRRLDAEPQNRDAWFLFGAASTELGEYADAIAAWERVTELQPSEPFKRLLVAYAHARAGNEESAREILGEIHELEDDPRWVNGLADAALVYGALGDTERAFALLDLAVDARARGVEYLMMGLWWLQFDPRADALRDDPRWDDLMRRIGPA